MLQGVVIDSELWKALQWLTLMAEKQNLIGEKRLQSVKLHLYSEKRLTVYLQIQPTCE